jgi:hypothetical protein
MVVAYLGWEEKWWKGKKLPPIYYFYSQRRERAWGGPLESVSDTDVVLGQRAIGTHQVPLFPVRLARGAVGLKLTRATVALGRAQFFTPNVFYFPN